MTAQNVEAPCDRSARLVAVWGPAGAPGRSTLSINLAAEFACLGLRVLLVDADTYGGSIAGYLELFDETPGFLAACRLAAMDELTEEELARLSHDYDVAPNATVTILSGIVNSARWPEVSAPRVRKGLSDLRPRFDVIVADLGFNLEEDEEISSDIAAPRRNQATLEILRGADAVLAVARADVIGLARFIHAFSRLSEACRSENILTIVNRAISSEAAGARHTLSRFAGIRDIVTVYDDDATFRKCLHQAMPLCIAAPQSAVRSQILDLVHTLLARCQIADIPGSSGHTPFVRWRAKKAHRLHAQARERAAS